MVWRWPKNYNNYINIQNVYNIASIQRVYYFKLIGIIQHSLGARKPRSINRIVKINQYIVRLSMIEQIQAILLI